MEHITDVDLNTLSYRSIFEFVEQLSHDKLRDEEYIFSLCAYLKNDNRKNVKGLGKKLENNLVKYKNEVERIEKLYEFDRGFGNFSRIAGVDEVGRGPLAGPIVAAAVILKNEAPLEQCMILGLNDSKKISKDNRERLYDIITSEALYYSIALLENTDIDELGIAYCNNRIFIDACDGLGVTPDFVISDGYPIRQYNIMNKGVVKGDTKSASIAAASIIAKVYRDRLMEQYSTIYPQYGFDKNAGYGTAEHIDAIKKYGITPIHRKSFLKSILSL